MDAPTDPPRKRGGRRRYDPTRAPTTVSLTAAVKARVQSIAERDGISMSNVIERTLCELVNVPVPHYCLPKPAEDQEELPLDEAS